MTCKLRKNTITFRRINNPPKLKSDDLMGDKCSVVVGVRGGAIVIGHPQMIDNWGGLHVALKDGQ